MKSICVCALIATLALSSQGFVVDVEIQKIPEPRPPNPPKHGIDVVVEEPNGFKHGIMVDIVKTPEPQPPKHGVERPQLDNEVKTPFPMPNHPNQIDLSQHFLNGVKKPIAPHPENDWSLSQASVNHGQVPPAWQQHQNQDVVNVKEPNYLKPQPPKYEAEHPIAFEPESSSPSHSHIFGQMPPAWQNHNYEHELPYDAEKSKDTELKPPQPPKYGIQNNKDKHNGFNFIYGMEIPKAPEHLVNQNGVISDTGNDKFEPTPKYPNRKPLTLHKN